MTPNQTLVHAYMDAFRASDSARVLACLDDDVEWTIPGAFAIRGTDAFRDHIVGEGFRPHPVIHVDRLIEANDVVVAEGRVRTERTDGTVVELAFCDVFDCRADRIRRLKSYLMPFPGASGPAE